MTPRRPLRITARSAPREDRIPTQDVALRPESGVRRDWTRGLLREWTTRDGDDGAWVAHDLGNGRTLWKPPRSASAK